MTLPPEHIALITTNAQALPVFCHSAILFVDNGRCMVVHNTMSGLEILPYDTFARKRKVYRIRPLALRCPFDVCEVVSRYGTIPFSWMHYNCEDFTCRVINRYTNVQRYIPSPQRCAITIAFFAIILFIITRK